MNKGFAKLSLLLGILVVIIIGAFSLTMRPTVQSVEATQIPVEDGCEHDCPTFEFSAKECPAGYSHWSSTFCEKNGQQFDLEPYNVFGPIEVQYTKSNDPNKCHRPAPATLDIPSWAVDNYNQDLDEHVNSIDVVPDGKYYSEGACYDKTPVCTDDSALNYDSEVDETEYSNNEVCEYNEEPKDVEGCTDPEALNYNQEATVDDGTCEYEEEPREEPKEECTENCGTPPTFAGSSTNAPVCSDKAPEKTLANFHILRTGETIIAKWVPDSGHSQAVIYYGLNNQGAQHSKITENDGYEEINLYSNADYTFWGAYKNGCSEGPWTQSVIDSGAPVTLLCTQGTVDLCKPI